MAGGTRRLLRRTLHPTTLFSSSAAVPYSLTYCPLDSARRCFGAYTNTACRGRLLISWYPRWRATRTSLDSSHPADSVGGTNWHYWSPDSRRTATSSARFDGSAWVKPELSLILTTQPSNGSSTVPCHDTGWPRRFCSVMQTSLPRCSFRRTVFKSLASQACS